MSYDIRFAVKVAGTEGKYYAVIGEPEEHSPTYNIGKLWRKAMDFDFEQGKWYLVTDLIPHFERGIHELLFNAKEYKSLEPDNGWGNTDTALRAMQSIMSWLTDDWNGIHGSWNADIPIEHIYMSW